jgi:hypothetical protein
MAGCLHLQVPVNMLKREPYASQATIIEHAEPYMFILKTVKHAGEKKQLSVSV